MKPSRIFRLSEFLAPFISSSSRNSWSPTTSPPGGDRLCLFQHQWQYSTEKLCFFNGLDEAESVWVR